jgi:hypothetical protein
MGIIKWWNDKWNKPEEAKQEVPAANPEPVLSDEIRVGRYIDDGGEIVDLTNKPRIDNDGFAPDRDLLQPFNQAHEGTKAGLNALVRGGKR